MAESNDSPTSEVAQAIADQLGVPDNPEVLAVLERCVQVLGVAPAQVLVQETLRIEEQGGMTKHDGTRRSLKGIYLTLIKQRVSNKERAVIFPDERSARRTLVREMTRQTRTAIAQEIAAQLGETEAPVLATIERCVKVLGAETARALVSEAQQTETQGGMLRKDGTRRTVGGIFFVLVKQRLAPSDRRFVFFSAKNRAAESS